VITIIDGMSIRIIEGIWWAKIPAGQGITGGLFSEFRVGRRCRGSVG
jgi:hypothetical protein